jgi:HK97 family phage prohead protease
MTTTLLATATKPGPDGNQPQDRIEETSFVLRQAQAVGANGRFNFLEGRAVPYDTPADIGWFVETHRSGSFKGSTKAGTGRALPLLLFHDNKSFPIGKAHSWRHDDGGLDGVWQMEDSAEAQRAAKAANDGMLTGLSIGFQPIRSQWELLDDGEWNPDLGSDHKDRVTRLESRLLEVSLTPTPAFADAQVDSVRHATVYTRAARIKFLPELDVDRWRRELDRLRT